MFGQKTDFHWKHQRQANQWLKMGLLCKCAFVYGNVTDDYKVVITRALLIEISSLSFNTNSLYEGRGLLCNLCSKISSQKCENIRMKEKDMNINQLISSHIISCIVYYRKVIPLEHHIRSISILCKTPCDCPGGWLLLILLFIRTAKTNFKTGQTWDGGELKISKLKVGCP